ncbi:MAG: NAD(P) transhydrogenase subunit alpha [Bacteroidota bacterium]
MIIAILKEPKDPRVAMVPKTVQRLTKAGHTVWVESGAGDTAYLSDAAFQEAGAETHARTDILKSAEVLFSIQAPSPEELQLCQTGATLIFAESAVDDPEIQRVAEEKGLTGFTLYNLPRTTRAQAMDILSSMASIAGYRSVLVAAAKLPRYFPLLMTAAGTIPPARVLVLGAGVAGLQAIATARRLGARVEAFDVRKATREEVESLGAKFVDVPGSDDDQTSGYAKEQSKAYLERQRETILTHISQADVVITTAQVRGRKAPILVDEEALNAMKPGSVIVDLAASTGGNCVRTKDQETVVYNGVQIIGDSSLAANMPMDASQLLSSNLNQFLSLLINKEGELHLNWEDEILEATCFTRKKITA